MSNIKPLNAKELYDYLESLKDQGHDLRLISVNYRFDHDSDVKGVSLVEEDLYDAKTNSVLESIVLVSK
jgi:hypothetical protein